ncbi:MAG: YeiH family protein [Victivallaceae bacterium]|nr:putative sulfate exporter family transporter [Victivallaceae bacterium]
MIRKTMYIAAAIFFFVLLWIIPGARNYASGAAVIGGALFAAALKNPFKQHSVRLVPQFLGAAIVGMGFGMNLPQVLNAGAEGILYTVVGIADGLGIGYVLTKKLALPAKTGLLISVGTSICGGSAIAAAAPAIKAKSHDIALATGIVFLLNAVALVIYPPIGHLAGLDQTQFGIWSALAIHDTSSVVGATMQYGPRALEVGTTVKLARALWIVPVSLMLSLYYEHRRNRAADGGGKRRIKIRVPWFIPGFLAAAVLVTLFPAAQLAGHCLAGISKNLMVVTLFLVGSNLSFDQIKTLGIRPVAHGVLLWLILSICWFAAVYFRIV